ncbi:hypothetical protein JXB28_00420 [Candidatus Woesearchaeota archaeon]|nr:hypothetical protein [Candidatus Woesearchaeota archaeon]
MSKHQTKKFHLGDVLSVTTGKLVSPEGGEGLEKIVFFMAHMPESNLPHAFLAAASICKRDLLKQFPHLKKVNAKGVNRRNWKKWLDKQIKKYGEFLEVKYHI